MFMQNRPAPAADCSTTGVKCSIVIPSGVQARLNTFSKFKTAGATPATISLQLLPNGGGTAITLFSGTADAFQNSCDTVLMSGDTIQWNVITAQAGATHDLFLSVSELEN